MKYGKELVTDAVLCCQTSLECIPLRWSRLVVGVTLQKQVLPYSSAATRPLASTLSVLGIEINSAS
jgi:hypothetical protein